ncbi:MAG: LexA family transcriptional regulator [Marinilabiliaceae bacterium]|nr:LexA family transcriptional regulator [Marinilabiliaceae bacterium]
MNNILGSNIKYLRKQKGLTQDQLANKIGITRAVIGSYEEGRATPKLSALQTLSHYFSTSLDQLVNIDLNNAQNSDENIIDITGRNMRILSTMVDRDNNELITLVPVKASAGYMTGYTDPDFIDTLSRFTLPLPELSREKTYRAFQIEGESMTPIPSGSYIICEYLQNWNEIKEGKAYILITKQDGVVYKRLYQTDHDYLLLKSDNPEFAPYNVPLSNVMEVWKALGYISFDLPKPDEMNLGKLTALFYKMQHELDELKEKNSD